ncbi:MAG: J domain-containing protein [Rectinemataceae bacterium]
MDQIFDRFERLIKSWVSAAADDAGLGNARDSRPFGSRGDPDLDAAMAELDDYLDDSRTATERREAEEARRKERERREREARARTFTGHPSEADRSTALAEAYRFLGLPNNAPFTEVKSAYKKLLLKYHPDRNSQSPEALKKSTDLSARINAAYQLIEAWEEASAKARTSRTGGPGGRWESGQKR